VDALRANCRAEVEKVRTDCATELDALRTNCKAEVEKERNAWEKLTAALVVARARYKAVVGLDRNSITPSTHANVSDAFAEFTAATHDVAPHTDVPQVARTAAADFCTPFAVDPDSKDGKEGQLVAFILPKVEALMQHFKPSRARAYDVFDTQQQKYLFGKAPDLTVTKHGAIHHIANLRPGHAMFLMEFKYEEAVDSNAVLGQVHVYAQAVFKAQTCRHHLIVIVANERGLARVDCTYTDALRLKYSLPANWSDAAGVIWRAMLDTEVHLPPVVQDVPLSLCIGSGAFSQVYESGGRYAVKLALGNTECTAAVQHEFRFLQRLMESSDWQHLLPHIPNVVMEVTSTCKRKGFAMTPLGSNFHSHDAPIRQGHIKQLVDVLQQLHHDGFVHRDVREKNMLVVDSTVSASGVSGASASVAASGSIAVLIDWAFVTKHTGAAVEYEGTLYSASNAVLVSARAAVVPPR
jgi:hypothetical protein